MSFANAEKIADAVLFEGYMLYPYRPSALKNRQRWNFGTLYPQTFAEAQRPQESFSFHAEVLVNGFAAATLDLRLRFLQLLPQPGAVAGDWEIGFVRARTVENIAITGLIKPTRLHFDLASLAEEEVSRAPSFFIERPCVVRADLSVTPVRDALFRVAVTIVNESPLAQSATRREAQAVSFTSAHLLLQAHNAKFISLLDPPQEMEAAVKACANRGVFPVLAGCAPDCSTMLCSPIILYDHPQIASESPGDFFDGTEMDEMLALRILTLTDEEKLEMRASDPHARAVLDRVEAMSGASLLSVHGTTRDLRVTENIANSVQPWNPFEEKSALQSVVVFGIEIHKGDRVRLWPQKKADIMDMALEGRVALVEAIEQDLENNVQFAVVLEEDPGRDMGMLRQAGHRFFFSPEEIEPFTMETP